MIWVLMITHNTAEIVYKCMIKKKICVDLIHLKGQNV